MHEHQPLQIAAESLGAQFREALTKLNEEQAQIVITLGNKPVAVLYDLDHISTDENIYDEADFLAIQAGIDSARRGELTPANEFFSELEQKFPFLKKFNDL